MDRDTISQQKKLFRKRIHDTVKNLTSEEISRQSAVITTKALSIPEYQNASTISVFLSMPGKEVSTEEIVKQAFKDGKKVYIPFIHASKNDPKNKIMDMLHLKDETDLNSLIPDAWGIPSLSKESIKGRENALGGSGCVEDSDVGIHHSMNLDLIFMPSVAFDSSLNRLGHGKGFYDRYLTLCHSLSSSSFQTRKVPHLVGLALKEQMLPPDELLPADEHDWKVDYVVTSDE